MKLVIGLMMSYLYADMLFIYVWGSICGLKYSKKITILGTIILWISDCMFKLFPQYVLGVQVSGAANMVMIVSGVIYVLILYNSSALKKILVFLTYSFSQAGMDMLGINIAGLLTGEYAFLDVESNFTFVMIGCSMITLTLGAVLFVWFWKQLERKKFKITGKQWLGLLLPMSQYAVIQGIALKYIQQEKAIPVIVGAGLIIGLIADIYMMYLFDKSNHKNLVEKELQQLSHQYELEQVRYEQLKKSQEETAKIRHDFQNYILTMKQME